LGIFRETQQKGDKSGRNPTKNFTVGVFLPYKSLESYALITVMSVLAGNDMAIAPGLSQTKAGLRAWNDRGIGKGGTRRPGNY
jgi:hypothetical protein